MKLAIMQPYFLPYLGYFQLMAAVDAFVVYDNIKYTKKGWINRNRLLARGQAAVFTVPLAQGSDQLDVRDRRLAEVFDRQKLLNQFAQAYRRAPQFERLWPWLQGIVRHPDTGLFGYLLHSIDQVRDALSLPTPLIVSSSVLIDHRLRGQDRVLALCQALQADGFVNPAGGVELYQPEVFAARGVNLQFLRSHLPPYAQGGHEFVPALSIVDVMMFNTPEVTQRMLSTGFELHGPRPVTAPF